MKKQAVRLLAGVAVAGVMATAGTWSNGTEAATASANVAVSASVSANCLVSAGTLSFGAYDPLSANDTAPLDASGTFTVRCTRGVSANIGLGPGLHFSTSRRMSDGGTNYLAYDLYSDAGRTTVWDNASNRVNYVAPNRSANTLTVYGRVPGAQDPAAGSYVDTVAAIAEF
jgi:spore coat protein U-like protein